MKRNSSSFSAVHFQKQLATLVITAIASLSLTAQSPSSPPKGKGPFRENNLVELISLDSTIRLDIRYATKNNFTGKAVYSEGRAFLQRPAAEALVLAHNWLKTRGFGILIYDAYRPWSVTKIFWDLTPSDKKVFVADPAQGSVHNRGCAVDIGLYDLKTGDEVEMPGAYDEMSERSFTSYTGGTQVQRSHRDLLRKAMEQDGNFFIYPEEWWHFNYKDFARYDIQDIPFSAIISAVKSETDTLTYLRQELLISVRDGIKLNTVIYTPKNISHSLPILFLRTPYGVSGRPSPNRMVYIKDIAKEGFIFVFQDIRGRY